MTKIPHLVLATHNAGKIAEIAGYLSDYVEKVSGAGALGLPEPEETGTTFAENAILKARAAAKASGLPALADDSGLCVYALDGAPGIYSARWAGPDKDFPMAMQRVHDELGDSPNRRAAFVCVLALAQPGGAVETFEGRIEGAICWPVRGGGGFGYDPFFVPEGESRTFGEMPPEEKRAMSHRAKALDSLRCVLRAR